MSTTATVSLTGNPAVRSGWRTHRHLRPPPEGFKQFDAVAERIIDVYTGVRRQRLVVTDRGAGRPQALDEEPQALHDKGGMSLAGRAEVGIDTEVDLDALVLEPAAPSPLQIGRLGHAPQTQQTRVERLRGRLAARRHSQLDVVYCHHRHSRSLFMATG